MRTITAASCDFAITIPGLYNSPQLLSGYMADDAFSSDDQELGETVMGVDGNMSVGYVPNPINMTVALMPDSLSMDIFENLRAAIIAGQETIVMSATLTMKSTGKQYIATKGILQKAQPHPAVKRVLQGIPYGIRWQSITPAQIASP